VSEKMERFYYMAVFQLSVAVNTFTKSNRPDPDI
jgi:hypothetical protein